MRYDARKTLVLVHNAGECDRFAAARSKLHDDIASALVPPLINGTLELVLELVKGGARHVVGQSLTALTTS
jgi:hypothetical protein